MHTIGKKNKYIGMLFMKISKEYFELGRAGIHKVSMEHVEDLLKYSPGLTHVVCTGLDARYDQVTVIEADTLEELHNAAVAFKMGAKAKYIDITDVVVGIKAPPRVRAAK
jgi:hypothetical protein